MVIQMFTSRYSGEVRGKKISGLKTREISHQVTRTVNKNDAHQKCTI